MTENPENASKSMTSEDTQHEDSPPRVLLYEEVGDSIGFVELVDKMGTDLSVVNAARVSFGVQREELNVRDQRLIRYLAEHRHTSPFEHAQVTFRIKVPLFVRSQHHRHRVWCLAGDAEVTFNRPDKWKKGTHCRKDRWDGSPYTMKALYEMWNKSEHHRNLLKNMLVRVYDEKEGKFSVSHVTNVFKSGRKEVFEIETSKGKKLKLTKDHQIMTSEGWQRLEDAIGLSVTSSGVATMSKKAHILTNGTTPWRSYDWMKKQREQGFSVQEIADNAGCSYVNIRKWLKIHDLQFDQIEAMLEHNKKHGVWNKGKCGYKTSHVVTEKHKEAIRKARSGPKSNFWKGGVTSERRNIARWTTENARKVHEKYDFTCQECGTRGGILHAHHIKPVVTHPELARDFNNLMTVCKDCHWKIHEKLPEGHGSRKGTPLAANHEEIVKVRLVGVEDVYDLSVKGPNHNFVANGMVVHNCYNEVSRRYTSSSLEFYEPTLFRTQHESNRQASNDDASEVFLSDGRGNAHEMLREHHERSVELFERMMAAGICREQARGVLPQNLYTMYYGTVDLSNLAKFYSLRTHEGAQWEIRKLAEGMSELVEPLFPHAWRELQRVAANH